ncbi:YhcG family protein [Methylicorpusculum sp.]|uniref:PDDEXK nuclease domain-containing protein n=1 Tax=Methylicorpusculum sp. TaxID=2713644 RepID=UPI00271AB749|nr:PDDEXK nuclease domain-containing protein [Methylicorpusculum sp.]MDO8845914.1 PDDEXK nuclease domain-containing protein [Methylicorpusculum sp.]
MTASTLFASADYQAWLKQIKQRVHTARMKIALAANDELITLYYELGAQIVERESYAQWGSGFIDAFSKDLKDTFPDIGGFSSKNLRYCRAFFRFYCSPAIWQQAVAKLESIPWAGVDSELAALLTHMPWGHNILIFTKSADLQEAHFYLQQTLESGWSRDVLALQLKSNLYARAGKAITNFSRTLPTPQSDLAQQTLKDPYTFDFMAMTEPFNERDVERQLTQHITQFLLELGKGFAFIGRQYHLEVAGNDYYIDLLFYHVTLKCYVVVELKNRRFIPEYAGKLNFYLSAVDSLLKRDDDQPTIGLLLCRDKNNIEVEFALRDMNKPMGVSEYTLVETLPDNLKGALPTIEEIENDLQQLQQNGNQERDL